MDEFHLLSRLGLAAAIGLLVGIERGWQEREERDGARVAGIRTYTLIGGLGGVCALLAANTPALLGICFAAFAGTFGFFEWRKEKQTGGYSATGLIAGLLTFVLGAYSVSGTMSVAAAAGVVTAVVLAERHILHGFLRRLKWTELRAALILLVMTTVLLPALPDRTVDPWNALNPHAIWLMTVLIAAVCYGGYVAMRLAGERNGLLYAGVMGGLVTSTTVTWTFARLAKRNPGAQAEVITAILAAWIVSLFRMTAIATVIAPVLLRPLLWPIAIAASIFLIPAVIAYRIAGRTKETSLTLEDPFDLTTILRFTALLAVIMLLAKLAANRFGETGLLALGAGSGILDVDPITLSMAKLVNTGLVPATAAATILMAAATNAISKAVLAFFFGGLRMGLILGAIMLGALVAGGLVFTSGV
jgi:uncharacterized membrane protein (DUF4010 family)